MEQVSGLAWMDVRKGPFWTDVAVPVDLSLRPGVLVLAVQDHRLGKKQRSALVRLCGDEVLSTLIAKREAPVIELPLAETRTSYPRVLGGGAIIARPASRPPLALKFVDPADTGDPMANPIGFTLRRLRAGPAARKRRNAWRERIEAARGG